jgi:hypothetical protein
MVRKVPDCRSSTHAVREACRIVVADDAGAPRGHLPELARFRMKTEDPATST